MKLILMMISVLLLSSCSSKMTKSVGHKSAYAPANYEEKGAVEYLNAGADWVIEKRREDAFKQMYSACNGQYEITREGNKSEFMTITMAEKNYIYIEFKCTGGRGTASAGTPSSQGKDDCGTIEKLYKKDCF
jgi:ABC-type transport system involved in cytochrome bd biosynthesis fused ATPase/permease subunit